jgi:hypothetical protein
MAYYFLKLYVEQKWKFENQLVAVKEKNPHLPA